ncbi:cytochrome P450 family protein [Streptomyces noursei]|uniref:cytochrome P450 family protein n=1 Tax=Streptomyces noursei TaxID=1971 RepID=UPI0023B79AAE|nr:cytochrome P450 [Streptomyces noursei]
MSNSSLPHADAFTAESLRDPHALYAKMRDEAPVQKVVLPQGLAVWLLTRYDDVRAALSDPRLRSDKSDVDGILRNHLVSQEARESWVDELSGNLLNTDPPDHTRLRRLVNRAFTPRTVAAMRSRIEEVTDELLDALPRGSEVDLLASFALPLPIIVICDLLGVPPEDRGVFTDWSNALLSSADAAETAAAGQKMFAFLGALLAEKRARPADDLLSGLVQVRDEEDRLSEEELISMALLLLVAGNESTVNLIGNSVLALLRHPDQLAALRADPALLPGAIEEFLRYDGPINTATFRSTAEPVTFSGVTIPAGELVVVSLLAANRDAGRFADPDRLDVTRPAGGHLGFGHGAHFCLGAPLARMEGEIALGRLLARFPDIKPALALDELTYRFSTIIHGLEKLPVIV